MKYSWKLLIVNCCYIDSYLKYVCYINIRNLKKNQANNKQLALLVKNDFNVLCNYEILKLLMILFKFNYI